MFQTGELVFSKYRILAFLGRGAFSEVYLVEHINLKITRALKCIRRCSDFNGFGTREADILKNLRHPAIPIIYDIEEREDCVCIIEEYVEGMSLNSFVLNHSRISTKEIAQLALQICEVVSYLHSKNILHGDIKPENIIYNGGRLYLIDYGNARIAGENNELKVGTRGFVAPEIYTTDRLKESSDVYSIGVIILWLATRKRDGTAISTIYSKGLKKLVSRCLSHSDKERIKTVKELIVDLNKLISSKVESEKVSRKIGFVGAYAHCGVTHCALLAGKYYLGKGMKVVLCERNCSNDYLKILSHKKHVSFSKGVFKAEGLCYVPWYYQCVTPDMELNMDRIIYDFGVLDRDKLSEALECDVLCVVTGARVYEKTRTAQFLRSLRKEKYGGKLRVLVNLADVKSYKELIKDKMVINPVRVGYHPEI